MVMLGWFVCPSVSMVTNSKATGLENTLFTQVIDPVHSGSWDQFLVITKSTWLLSTLYKFIYVLLFNYLFEDGVSSQVIFFRLQSCFFPTKNQQI